MGVHDSWVWGRVSGARQCVDGLTIGSSEIHRATRTNWNLDAQPFITSLARSYCIARQVPVTTPRRIFPARLHPVDPARLHISTVMRQCQPGHRSHAEFSGFESTFSNSNMQKTGVVSRMQKLSSTDMVIYAGFRRAGPPSRACLDANEGFLRRRHTNTQCAPPLIVVWSSSA